MKNGVKVENSVVGGGMGGGGGFNGIKMDQLYYP